MIRKQTGDVQLGDNLVWGLAWKVVDDSQGSTALLSKGSFGKGGAGNIIWADPKTNTIYIVMQNISGGDNMLGMQAVLETIVKATNDK